MNMTKEELEKLVIVLSKKLDVAVSFCEIRKCKGKGCAEYYAVGHVCQNCGRDNSMSDRAWEEYNND